MGLTYYTLITDVNTQLVLRKSKREPVSTMYAVCFFLLMGCSRLPPPWTLLFIGGIACLVPTLQGMRELSGEQELAEGDRWRTRHTLAAIFGVVFFALAMVGLSMREA